MGAECGVEQGGPRSADQGPGVQGGPHPAKQGSSRVAHAGKAGKQQGSSTSALSWLDNTQRSRSSQHCQRLDSCSHPLSDTSLDHTLAPSLTRRERLFPPSRALVTLLASARAVPAVPEAQRGPAHRSVQSGQEAQHVTAAPAHVPPKDPSLPLAPGPLVAAQQA